MGRAPPTGMVCATSANLGTRRTYRRPEDGARTVRKTVPAGFPYVRSQVKIADRSVLGTILRATGDRNRTRGLPDSPDVANRHRDGHVNDRPGGGPHR